MPKYMFTKEGQVVEIPSPVEEKVEVIPPEERIEALPPDEVEEKPGELDDLFEVPQPEDNDMRTDIALDIDEEDIIGGSPDMSDLVDVSEEDIMGGDTNIDDLVDIPDEVFSGAPPAEEPERVKRPVARNKRYRIVRRESPPTSLRGIQ